MLNDFGLIPNHIIGGWMEREMIERKLNPDTNRSVLDYLDPFQNRCYNMVSNWIKVSYYTLVGGTVLGSLLGILSFFAFSFFKQPITDLQTVLLCSIFTGVYVISFVYAQKAIISNAPWVRFLKDFRRLVESHPYGLRGLLNSTTREGLKVTYEMLLTNRARSIKEAEHEFGVVSEEAEAARKELRNLNMAAVRFNIVDGVVTKYFAEAPVETATTAAE